MNEVAERMGRAPEDVAQALAATTPPLSLTGGEEDGSGQIDLPEEGPEERLSDLLSLQQLLSSLEERDRAADPFCGTIAERPRLRWPAAWG